MSERLANAGTNRGKPHMSGIHFVPSHESSEGRQD
jgi:hypothetical protein